VICKRPLIACRQRSGTIIATMPEPVHILIPVLLVLAVLPVWGANSFDLSLPVDPDPVRREIIGINLNYLLDGELLEPPAGQPLVAGLRALGVRNLRFPGGNKSDSRLWSVPPYRQPAPRLAVTGEWDWPAMDERVWDRPGERAVRRVMDTDDALAVASGLDAELVMVIPYDEAYPDPTEEAGRYAAGPTIDTLIELTVAWARYCQAQGRLPRYWELGNETYFHQGVTARRYAQDLVRFAEALHAVDPAIRVGANGSENVGDVADGDRHAGTGERWWPVVLELASGHIDYLSLHRYPCYGWGSFAAYADQRPKVIGQLRQARRLIDQHAAEGDRQRIELLITETNSADWLSHPANTENWPHVGSIGHALVLFDMLAQYLACDDLAAVQVWNTRWVEDRAELWDALAADNAPSAIGQAMALWQRAGSHWLQQAQTGENDPLLCVPTWEPTTGATTVFLINRRAESHPAALTGAALAEVESVTVQAWSGEGPDDLAPQFSEPAPADPAALSVPAAGMLIVQWQP
jgi:alpha-N-arabinofuranosidase